MKHIITFCLMLMLCVSGYAQQNPNRMLVVGPDQQYKGFLVERVDSIVFKRVEGEVAAKIELIEAGLDKLIVSITRTKDCVGFKLNMISQSLSAHLTDDAVMAKYIDDNSPTIYYKDFDKGTLTGVEILPNTDYMLVSVGLDQFGIPCGVSRVTFTSPKKPLVGDPKVAIKVTDVQQRIFTAEFEPNKDVAGYAVLALDRGSLQEQFELFGPMIGFQNIGDMIKSFGANFTTASSFTWKDMNPGNEYTIYVQAWDAEGTYTDVFEADVTTLQKGGSGEPVVDIKLGDYKLMEWDGQQKPSQFITFTPNDQTNCYRIAVYEASDYDEAADEIKEELKQDPPGGIEIVGWFFYDPLTTDYQIDPNTEAVALAVGKNADGKWGVISEFRFTTPSAVTNAPAYQSGKATTKIKARTLSTPKNEKGKAPVIKTKKGLQLTQN